MHTQHKKQYKTEKENYSIGITFELIVTRGPGAWNYCYPENTFYNCEKSLRNSNFLSTVRRRVKVVKIKRSRHQNGNHFFTSVLDYYSTIAFILSSLLLLDIKYLGNQRYRETSIVLLSFFNFQILFLFHVII